MPGTLWHLRPTLRRARGPVLAAPDDRSASCRSSSAWPRDGGAFVTLPQVYTEDADRPGWRHSNLGMYRVQLSGNEYEPDREVGLHYQIHRGIGVHHAAALRRGVPFRVNIFVGGPPAMTLAAVMPLPEGLPELAFAGALGGRRVPARRPPEARSADARRGRLLHHRHRRSATPACPKGRSATTSAITAWPTSSRC